MSDKSNATYQIDEWFSNSPEKVEILRTCSEDKKIMSQLSLGHGSYLGEIADGYSKISLCNGYFSLLCGKGYDSIVDINAIDDKGMPQLFPGALVIAYDREGNIFALNSGAVKNADMGSVLYLHNSSFEWENLDISYAQFLRWISSVNMAELVKNAWKSKNEVEVKGAFVDYLIGKAAAYNMFLKLGG